MGKWNEVAVAREDALGKATQELYVAQAETCSQAEAAVLEELAPMSADSLKVTAVKGVKMADVVGVGDKEKWWKVRACFVTIDERTAQEKRKAAHYLVAADTLAEAVAAFKDYMRGTLADWELSSVAETAVLEVYREKKE